MNTATNPRAEIIPPDHAKSLGAEKAAHLAGLFSPRWDALQTLASEANDILVTDATQVSEMKKARMKRLEIRKLRLEVEGLHKENKAAILVEGQALDFIKRSFLTVAEPAETRLEEMEKFAERAEAARKAELRKTRAAALFAVGVAEAGYNLAEMPVSEWLELISAKERAFGERKAQEAKEAAEKAEQAKRDSAERERLRAENERLRAEQAQKDAEAKAERDAAAKQLAAERAEADRLRRKQEDIERGEAERKAEREAEEARLLRAAEQAPDAEKLRAFRKRLDELYLGEAMTPAGKAVFAALERNMTRLMAWCIDKANELEDGESTSGN